MQEADMTTHIIARGTNDRIAVGAALVLGALGIANGAAMLLDPVGWYWRVPGVPSTGPFNQHFVRDIGLAFALSGASFVAGALRPDQRIALWAAASAWLIGHALFHLWEVAAGICSADVIPRDFLGVTLPGLVGLALTLHAIRRGA